MCAQLAEHGFHRTVDQARKYWNVKGRHKFKFDDEGCPSLKEPNSMQHGINVNDKSALTTAPSNVESPPKMPREKIKERSQNDFDQIDSLERNLHLKRLKRCLISSRGVLSLLKTLLSSWRTSSMPRFCGLRYDIFDP
jgi:hypothetical protein